MRALLRGVLGILVIVAPLASGQDSPSAPEAPSAEPPVPEAPEDGNGTAAAPSAEPAPSAPTPSAAPAPEAPPADVDPDPQADAPAETGTNAASEADASKGEQAPVGPPSERFICTVLEDATAGQALDCVPADEPKQEERGFRLVGSGPWLPQEPGPRGTSVIPANSLTVSTARTSGWWALGVFGFGAVALGAVARRRPTGAGLVAPVAEQPNDATHAPTLEDLARRVDEHPMEGAAAFELAMRLFEGNDERGLRYLSLAVRLDPMVLLPFLREPTYEDARQRPEVRSFLRGVQRERERALVSYA